MQVLESVLLVDDDDVANDMHENIIRELGLVRNVIRKQNGKEAFEFITKSYRSMERLPSLILADLEMPVMDGFSFIEEVKNSDLLGVKKIPFAVLSVTPEPKTKEEIERIGGYYFVSKPLDKLKFFDILHTTTLQTLSHDKQLAVLERQHKLEQQLAQLKEQNIAIRSNLEKIKSFRLQVEEQLKNFRK